MTSNVPAGWSVAPLGDVCQVVSGATPKTGVSEYWGGEITWITPDDLSNDRAQYLSTGRRSLTQAGYNSCSARIFPAGSVMYSSRAPIGYVAIAGAPACTNQGCKTAVPPDYIDSRFLYWYLTWRTPEIQSRASGTTFREISGKRFAETTLAWPKLQEQRRIVDTLEDHLSQLDAADQAVDQAMIKATAWRESVAEALLRATAGQVRPVGNLLLEPMRNGHSARASSNGEGVRTLTLTAVTRRCFEDRFTKLTTADQHRVSDLWLEPDDILVERSNTAELVGTTALYTGPDRWAIFPDLVIRLRPDPSVVTPRFLAAVMSSERCHRWLRERAKGLAGSMPKIDQMTIAQLPVPVPLLVDQEAFVQQLDSADAAHARLQGATRAARLRSTTLRSSILDAAFSGRLVRNGVAGKAKPHV